MKVDQYRFLREVALFEQLRDEELAEVAGMFRERTYRKNDIIFFEEDTGNYMYIVKDGRVKVSRLLPNGKEMILAFRETGEYFGEMSLLDGGTSAATVTAVIPATILFTTQRDFQKLLSNASINAALLRMLCTRCREAWSQIEVLTFHNADARIRTALYYLSQKKGVHTKNGTRIDLKLTHKELADMTGISRETAPRVPSALQSNGVLKVQSRHFVLSDPDELVDPLLME